VYFARARQVNLQPAPGAARRAQRPPPRTRARERARCSRVCAGPRFSRVDLFLSAY